jgi:hypothetical protein
MSKHTTISPQEAADRLTIRELVEAYAHCADRRDAKGQRHRHGAKYPEARLPYLLGSSQSRRFSSSLLQHAVCKVR